MHRTARLETSKSADNRESENFLTGGDEVDLRGGKVVGLLEFVESAQNQPILMQKQVLRQREIEFEDVIKEKPSDCTVTNSRH